jgi:hypothetical protein
VSITSIRAAAAYRAATAREDVALVDFLKQAEALGWSSRFIAAQMALVQNSLPRMPIGADLHDSTTGYALARCARAKAWIASERAAHDYTVGENGDCDAWKCRHCS